VSETELPHLRAEAPPIFAQLRSDAIHLSGPTISMLLGSGIAASDAACCKALGNDREGKIIAMQSR
jgi:hypothetical protein